MPNSTCVLWGGTGATERRLGQDVAIQKQHEGNRTRTSVAAHLYALLLEFRVEGPQREEYLSTADTGVMLLTDVPDLVLQEWSIMRGRRFATDAVHKDVGKPASLGKSKHTDRVVQSRKLRGLADSDQAGA